jgi:hypothetical protein
MDVSHATAGFAFLPAIDPMGVTLVFTVNCRLSTVNLYRSPPSTRATPCEALSAWPSGGWCASPSKRSEDPKNGGARSGRQSI